MPFIPFCGEILNSTPLQITKLIDPIVGFGSTRIVTVKFDPLQLPSFGETKNEAV